jgi:glycosyltransferase involved in cell wall biosynthesis
LSRLPTLVWCGRFSNEDGYGTAARSLVKAARAAEIPYLAIDSTTLTTFGASHDGAFTIDTSDDLLTVRAADPSTKCIVIVHDRPDRYPAVGATGRVRRVGFSYCEALTLPDGWITNMVSMDEVWTSSENNRSTFSFLGVPDRMLRTIPIPTDVDHELGDIQRRARWEGATVFLSVASGLARRDLRVLFEAYFRAFSADDDAILVLKVRPGDAAATENALTSVMLADPGRRSGTWPRVEVIEADLTREQMHRLHSETDAYVSTERGNGWCIPAFDSMALGRPVISFDWGGSAEFFEQSDCYLVPVHEHLVYGSDSVHGSNWMYDTNLWPAVDPIALAKAFQTAATDPDDRRERGKRAADRLSETMDPNAVGRHLLAMITDYQPSDYRSDDPAVIEVASKASRWKASPAPSTEHLLELRLVGLASEPRYRLPRSPKAWFDQYKEITSLATAHRRRLPSGSELSESLGPLVATPTSRPLAKAQAIAAFHSASAAAARRIGSDKAREAAETMRDHELCVQGKATSFSLDEALARRGLVWAAVGGVQPNAQDLRRLAAIHGSHEGERVIILGDGPSFDGLDLSLLMNVPTFGINRVLRRASAGGWQPDHYTIDDNSLKAQVDQFESIAKATTFLPERFRGLIKTPPTTLWFHMRAIGDHIDDQFEIDATQGVPTDGWALTTAIQLAFHLGYRDLVLLGVEPDSDIGLDRLEREFSRLRNAAEFHGGRLRNATPNSSFAALEKVDLADLI